MKRLCQLFIVSIALASASPALAAVTVQNRTVLTIIVNVPGMHAPNAPRDMVAQTLFASNTESVATNYRIASYGQVNFVGGVSDVVGPYTISPAGNICDNLWDVVSKADQAAQSSGVNVNAYQHHVYILPPDSPCGWTGLSMIGGQHVWIRGSANDVYLFQHELGHNLGMDHANEGADVMGSGHVTFNAPHIVQMGWLNSLPGKIIDITSSQTLSLETLEKDPLAGIFPKILRIKPPGSSDTYYLSYRESAGNFSLSPVYTRGLNLHIWNGGAPGQSFTNYLAALNDGVTYSKGSLTVKQLAHIPGERVDLQITIDSSVNQPLTVLNPISSSQSTTLGLDLYSLVSGMRLEAYGAPQDWGYISAGAYVEYQLDVASGGSYELGLKVAGYDNSSVDISINGASQGSIAISPTGGWDRYQPAPIKGITLPTGRAVLRLSTPTGGFNISEIALRPLVVLTPTPTPSIDRTAPTVAITSPSNGSRVPRRSIMTTTAEARDNVGVTRVDFYVNGARVCSDYTSPHSCSWRTGRYSGIRYVIQAVAYDAAGNRTVSSSVTVTTY